MISCDTIEFPYVSPKPAETVDTVGGIDSISKIQKIMLEEYTGHTCGNCPIAAATGQGLKQTYGEKLILISIHDGFFALPQAPPYQYDFRTSVGTTYASSSYFDVTTHPMGLINRVGYPDNHKKTPGNWSAVMDSLAADTLGPPIYIGITNIFNSSTRLLNSKIKLEVRTALTGEYKLTLLFIEDSIQKAQVDYNKNPQDILDYWHRHVVRGAINGAWGDGITVSLPGEKQEKEYSFTVPENYFGYTTRFEQCYVVAFVYDNTPPSPNYKIIQVEEKKINL